MLLWGPKIGPVAPSTSPHTVLAQARGTGLMGDAYIGPGAEKLSYQGVLYTSTCSGRFCAELPDLNVVGPLANFLPSGHCTGIQ